jgi:hypothetical protein
VDVPYRHIARRTQKDTTTKRADMLYLNDGLYGRFSMKWSRDPDRISMRLPLARGKCGCPSQLYQGGHKYFVLATTKRADMLYLNDGLYGRFSMKWSEDKIFVSTLIHHSDTACLLAWL